MNSYCFACDVWHPVMLFTIIYNNTHSQQNIFIIKIINHYFNNNNNNNNNKICSPCVLLFISYNIANYLLGNISISLRIWLNDRQKLHQYLYTAYL